MHAYSRILLLCGLLATLIACGHHKSGAPLTAEQQKSQDDEKQKQQEEAALRRREYHQFLSNIRQLEVGAATTNDVRAVLGNPAHIAGDNWIYEVHPTPTDPIERYTLIFRNGVLAAVSSSGVGYIQGR